MASSRIAEALAVAGGWPDAGDLLALRPVAGSDLAALPRDRTQIITGFRPDHDHLSAQGWRTHTEPSGQATGAIIFLPRARAHARALVHAAASHLPQGAPILIDGQKNEGIESALADVRARADVIAVVSKAHGRAIAFANPGGAAFADWQARPRSAAPGFVTLPGIFSADGPDPGSVLLARCLPPELKGRAADLGAGWGWLAAQALVRPGLRELHLIEAESDALACARLNVSDPRARFHWADATTFDPGHRFDLVVMNPPFHPGRAADPGLGAAFIRAARRLLHPPGDLWMVANRHLPYEDIIAACFLGQQTVAREGGFKVIRASRPRKVA